MLQLIYEPYSGDDTAVNGMEVICRGPGMDETSTAALEQKMTFSDSRWSTWSGACSPGSAVCSLITRVESPQDTSWGIDIDDGALTDARLHCCDF